MRWQTGLTVIVLGLGLLILAPWALGHFLPAETSATVSREFDASPALVWSLVSDPQARPAWLENVQSVESRGLNPAGLPRWQELRRDGSRLTLEQTALEPMRLERFHSISAPAGYAERWRISIEARGGRTRVTVHETVRWDNAYLRTLSYFLSGTRSSVARVLDSLEQALQGNAMEAPRG